MVGRRLVVVGGLGAVVDRLGAVGLGVGDRRRVGGGRRVVGGRGGLGALVEEGLDVGVDDGRFAVLLGAAEAVGLAADAEAGVRARVGQGGRQRHEGKEGEEGLEFGFRFRDCFEGANLKGMGTHWAEVWFKDGFKAATIGAEKV